jgi:endo-1,3-1,4-beta-glycanase ExoK
VARRLRNLEPENVSVEDGQLRRALPAKTLDGGEIEAKYSYGSATARLLRGAHQGAKRPSSITGFFRYEPPDFESEIDVEIYNDSSRRVLFTTYAGPQWLSGEESDLDRHVYVNWIGHQ